MNDTNVIICENCKDYILFIYKKCLYEYQPDNGKIYYADNDEPYEITGNKKELVKKALFKEIKE